MNGDKLFLKRVVNEMSFQGVEIDRFQEGVRDLRLFCQFFLQVHLVHSPFHVNKSLLYLLIMFLFIINNHY